MRLAQNWHPLFLLGKRNITIQKHELVLELGEPSSKFNNLRFTLSGGQGTSITFRGHPSQLRHKAVLLHVHPGHLGSAPQRIVRVNIIGTESRHYLTK